MYFRRIIFTSVVKSNLNKFGKDTIVPLKAGFNKTKFLSAFTNLQLVLLRLKKLIAYAFLSGETTKQKTTAHIVDAVL